MQVATFVEPDDGQLRFEVELEFVQLLANPAYIHRKKPAAGDVHAHKKSNRLSFREKGEQSFLNDVIKTSEKIRRVLMKS